MSLDWRIHLDRKACTSCTKSGRGHEGARTSRRHRNASMKWKPVLATSGDVPTSFPEWSMLCWKLLRGITSVEKCTANGFCMGQTELRLVFLIIKVEYEIRKPFADSSLEFANSYSARFWTKTVRPAHENRTVSDGLRLYCSSKMPEDLVLM